MSYTYSQDRHYDKWETVSDVFDTYLDELEQEQDEQDVFIAVDNFDELEIL